MTYITILDAARAKGALPDESGGLTMAEFDRLGLPFFSGCRYCGASLGPSGAYPSSLGSILCRNCVGGAGFETIEAFDRFEERR